jgi:hypothetical protein
MIMVVAVAVSISSKTQNETKTKRNKMTMTILFPRCFIRYDKLSTGTNLVAADHRPSSSSRSSHRSISIIIFSVFLHRYIPPPTSYVQYITVPATMMRKITLLRARSL